MRGRFCKIAGVSHCEDPRPGGHAGCEIQPLETASWVRGDFGARSSSPVYGLAAVTSYASYPPATPLALKKEKKNFGNSYQKAKSYKSFFFLYCRIQVGLRRSAIFEPPKLSIYPQFSAHTLHFQIRCGILNTREFSFAACTTCRWCGPFFCAAIP